MNTFTIYVWTSWQSERHDHKFKANNNREVVGLMKTIMDNFKPVHIDIINDDSFNNNILEN